ncbi:acyl-CoA thioesterase [Sinimarinibacterium thermocellulolyticum]|uniref:Thioesterase family protein n=1 Tax=Sinimarinibacterium thermocellulolyticum TaxID=3170016 RepID=A0ABV2AAR8_9GAMM
MIFRELLDSLRRDDEGWQVAVGEDWLQGRTAFGGLQAALCVRALRDHVPADLPLRALQTTFVAPVPAGMVRLQGRVLRIGGFTVHAECRIVDGEQTLCLVVAIFGKSRGSELAIAPPQPDAGRAADGGREFRYVEGVTPAFTQHFVMRWSQGGFPFQGASEPRTCIHVRHREAQALDETHLIALADTVPSPGLSVLRKRAMASSMTWTLELFDQRTQFAFDAFWRMDTEVTAGADGYLGQSAQLWTPDGRLAALSRQSVVVFG